jgi:hypothetical protein
MRERFTLLTLAVGLPSVVARHKQTGETMEEKGWSILATYSSGLEADIAMGQLEEAGIPALRDSNDAAAIFGASVQGTTPRGFTVRVPTDALDDARAVAILPSDII